MIRLLLVVIGYCFGCIQTSFIYGKKQGLDIREHGSGNAGATNALRVMGKKSAAIVFVGDMGKMFLALFLMLLVFRAKGPDYVLLIKLYTGLGVILGHDFPFYMGFRGGKGVASTAAMILLLDWRMAVLAVLVFFGIVLCTRIVSLASCVTAVCSLILMVILVLTGLLSSGVMPVWEPLLVFGFIVLLTLLRHTENVKRLVKGTENKLNL